MVAAHLFQPRANSLLHLTCFALRAGADAGTSAAGEEQPGGGTRLAADRAGVEGVGGQVGRRAAVVGELAAAAAVAGVGVGAAGVGRRELAR